MKKKEKREWKKKTSTLRNDPSKVHDYEGKYYEIQIRWF